MMESPHIVLLGAGNANLVELRHFAMEPHPNARITLVNPNSSVPYSAMIPGYIAGFYKREQIEIDLVRLCHRAKARLVLSQASEIQAETKRLLFPDRPELDFDWLSICIGSQPQIPANAEAIPTKPLSNLVRWIECFHVDQDPFHFVVIGAGASGVELMLALHTRYRRDPRVRLTIVEKGSLTPAIRRILRTVRHSVAVLEKSEAIGVSETDLLLRTTTGESRIACHKILWATPATSITLKSDLKTDSMGFFTVDRFLRCDGFSDIYASGDCASLSGYTLPRAGVYSVRQGRYLWSSLTRRLNHSKVRAYRPKPRILTILNTADGKALLRYGRFSVWSRTASRLKQVIDRRWIESFSIEETVPMSSTGSSMATRCGGCGSKISHTTLSRSLMRLKPLKHAREVFGLGDFEDVAAFLPDKEKLQVVTTDYFRTFLSDPFTFGKIAVIHALSDLYAKGAIPVSALCTAVVPYDGDLSTTLSELLGGVDEALRRERTALIGGHTAEGSVTAVGITAIGECEPQSLLRKNTMKEGDSLVLTKGLGTGILMAAHAMGELRAHWYDAAIDSMLQSNRAASELFGKFPVTAATDVTGFGLAGHMLEMLRDTPYAVCLSEIPLLPGAEDLLARGIKSSLHEENKKGVSLAVTERVPELLFDPQTSGGLLVSISNNAEDLVLKLRSLGYPFATIVGRVERSSGGSRITFDSA